MGSKFSHHVHTRYLGSACCAGWWKQKCEKGEVDKAAAVPSHVALLVGIGDYQHYPKLHCTRADVSLVSQCVAKKHFIVSEVLDCTLQGFSRALTKFASSLRSIHMCGVVLVYFACHAVEHSGCNLLLCIDSDPGNMKANPTLDSILKCVADAADGNTKIVFVLDGCREPTILPSLTAMHVSRKAQCYVVFACGSGQSAKENANLGQGYFTVEFAKFLDEQTSFSITSENFAAVRLAVQNKTHGFQRPELLCSSSAPWAATFWNVPLRNLNFVGRGDLLDRLHRRIRNPGVLCVTAASGLSGVGKTQIVVELLYLFHSHRHIVWWLNAENDLDMQHGLAALAVRMQLVTETEVALDVCAAAQKTVTNLQEILKAWILVFDNARSFNDVKRWIPSRGGVVLVTSRNPNWNDSFAVHPFHEHESVELLRKFIGDNEDSEHAALVADALGHLPLALVQAGGWARETGMGLKRYAHLLRERKSRAELMAAIPDALVHSGYDRSVRDAVNLLSDAIETKDTGLVALLRFCSMIAPFNIPYDLVHCFCCRYYRNESFSEVGFSKAMKDLCDVSLIQRTQDFDGGQFTVHALVRSVVQDGMVEIAQFNAEKSLVVSRSIEAALQTLVSTFPYDSGTNVDCSLEKRQSHYACMASHCSSLLNFCKQLPGFIDSDSFMHLCNELKVNLADYHLDFTKDFTLISSLLDEALASLPPAIPGRGCALRVRIFNIYAMACNNCTEGREDKRQGYLEEALKYVGSGSAPEHDCHVHANLAFLFGQIGEEKVAEIHKQESLSIIRTAGLQETMVESMVLSTVAFNTHLCNSFDEAIELQNKVYTTRAQLFGKIALKIMHSLSELTAYCSLGDPERGVCCGKELVSIREDTLGNCHVLTARARMMLTLNLFHAGNYREAKQQALEAMNVLKGGFFRANLSLHLALSNIALKEDIMESIQLVAESLDLFQQNRLCKRYSKCYFAIAWASSTKGDSVAALTAGEKALGDEDVDALTLQSMWAFLAMGAASHTNEDATRIWFARVSNYAEQWPVGHPHRHWVEQLALHVRGTSS